MEEQTFAVRHVAIRSRFHLDQIEVAKRVGVGRSAVGNWDKGRTQAPEGPTLRRLLRLYGVSSDWLLGEPGARQRSHPAIVEACSVITARAAECEGQNAQERLFWCLDLASSHGYGDYLSPGLIGLSLGVKDVLDQDDLIEHTAPYLAPQWARQIEDVLLVPFKWLCYGAKEPLEGWRPGLASQIYERLLIGGLSPEAFYARMLQPDHITELRAWAR